jgi:transglutaminase-like putative cysteine protease
VFARSINEYLFMSGSIEAMKIIQRPEVVSAIKANITAFFGGPIRYYTIEELFQWENYYLKWTDTMLLINRHSDPREILNFGRGKCQEYSVLFASACVAMGRDVKLVICEESDYSAGPHAWNQVIINGSWTDVDSSLSMMNSSERYRSWYWWSGLGKDYFIFAFDQNETCEDITNQFT